MESVTIPSSVTSIGECAFFGCENLVEITIPDNVTYLGESAFASCSNLSNITIPFGVVVKPQIISGDFRRLFKTEIPVTVCGQ